MHLMHSEVFSTFLVSLLLFYAVKTFHSSSGSGGSKKYIILSGFIIGYTTLTKVVFGYVMLVFLIVLVFLWLMNRNAVNYRKSLLILLVAFITVAPYLIYTYNLTGKVYYWSTYGGETLYWMSTGHQDQYGSWFAVPNRATNFVSPEDSLKKVHESGYLNIYNRQSLIPGVEDSIKLHHQSDFDEIFRYSTNGVERDNAFKRIAIRNIKANPVTYVKNCFNNVGRILFNYPYSYAKQKPSTLLRLPLNSIIIVFLLFCLIPTFLNWKKVIYSVRFLMLFVLVYLGGSVLGTAETRMFSMIVPILLFWIAYTLFKTVKVDLKFN
jgi:4-amino-4-deoxy-L-arabinose transferase-like glycosyltransferase